MLLACWLLVPGGRSDAQEATVEGAVAEVGVQLRTQKLRLARGGLRGTVWVTLTNAGEVAVVLEDPEVHGLVFEHVETGALHVLVHPCQCVRDVRSPEGIRTIELEPGGSHEIVLEEFGCAGSMWAPPPRGTYRVTYRLHRADGERAFGNLGAPEGSPPEQSDWCRTMLQDPARWEGAWSSDPVEIRLK